jgi:hypothetical protein
MGSAMAPTGPGNVFTSSATYSFDPGADAFLAMSLLGSNGLNHGFDQAVLTIIENGSDVLSQTFTSLASASAYFSDHVLDLGEWVGGRLDLEIQFVLTASALPVGFQGFGFDYLLSGSTHPIVGATPIPPALMLFVSALLLLSLIAYRNRRAVGVVRAPN